MVEVLVLTDFQGQLEDELHIKVGDTVRNVKKSGEDGWLEGDLNGKRGVFPHHFVKEIPAAFMGDGGQKYPRSIRKPKVQAVKKQKRWCKANFSYSPEKPDELELIAGDIVEVLHEIEDGWWLGKKNVQTGAFPSNYVEELPDLPLEAVPDHDKKNWAVKQRPKLEDTIFFVKEMEKPKSQEKSSASSQKDKEYCKVMFDYEPAFQDELALKKGDVVCILQKETDSEGWWEGELNGRTGLFPDNFVILLPPASQTTNHPPARTTTSKGQATKQDQSAMENKSSEVSKAENKPSKQLKESKDTKTDLPSKPSHLHTKKPAPAPPVPAKTKSSPGASNRASGDLQGAKPVEVTKEKPTTVYEEKSTLPEVDSFDAILVSSSKLSHLTADRPKVQGKRPPTHPCNPSAPEETAAQPESKQEAEEKPKAKNAAKGKDSEHSAPAPAKVKPQLPHPARPGTPEGKKAQPAKATSAQAKRKAVEEVGDKATIEELRTEIRSLRMLMELMKTQYERELADIKQEMKEERAKRSALQIEIEKLSHLLPA